MLDLQGEFESRSVVVKKGGVQIFEGWRGKNEHLDCSFSGTLEVKKFPATHLF